jgi:prepilin-type N-terminal cleavage/methylation domain-containing protein
MKTQSGTSRSGFTLIEILAVIAIVAILAAILVPVAGKARETAMKRRAALEMGSIKMAVLQFQREHRYMPWGDPANAAQQRVGDDVWTSNSAEREQVMRWLTGENPMGKTYLQVPERSRKSAGHPLIFTDPWGQDYRIGMDRNLDGVMLPNDPDGLFGGANPIKEPVAVYSLGPETPASASTALKTFDWLP